MDWLNATFDDPAGYANKAKRYSKPELVSLLSRVFGRPIVGVEARGIFGFDHSVKLLARVGSAEYSIGCIAWGGESQKGRAMLQLTGAGCGVVRSWSRLRKLLQALKARITRVDLCIDYMEGEYSVEDAVAMYRQGNFNLSGRPPMSRLDGDWLDGKGGRTLYVGRAENGKMLRVYEKGRQLGNQDSSWTRFEVQLGNRDRVIPLEVLTRRDAFLAGCYPALALMLDEAAEVIATTRTEGAATLAHLMFHLKRSYGKLIGTVFAHLDCHAWELVESVSVCGAPRRLKPDAITAQLTWDQLLSHISRK